MERARAVPLFALLATVVSTSGLMAVLYRMYYLPPGFDVGAWIRYAKALMGESGSPWVGQYQPYLIHNGLLALFLKGFGDEVLAAQAFAVFLFALRPLATYLLSFKILGSRGKALLVSFFVALHASFFEVWGWGGYPNLFGFALLPLALYFVVGAVEKGGLRSLLLAAAFSLLVAPSHLLTGVVLAATLLVWLFIYGAVEVVSGRGFSGRFLTIGFISVLSVAALLGCGWFAASSGWVEANPASAANRIGLDDLVYAFHGFRNYLSIVFAVVAVPCLFTSFRRAVRGAEEAAVLRYSLLFSYVLAPLGLTQLWVFGVTADFVRFLFFLIQPLAISIADHVNLCFPPSPRRWLGDLRATSLLVLLVSVSLLSVPASFDVVKWYHLNLPPGGDAGVLEAVEWMRLNSQAAGVVVCSQYLGEWVGGLADRKVLQTYPLRFAFSRGEVERSMDADTILSSTYTLTSGDFQVVEQGRVLFLNPLVRVNRDGVYQDLVHLNDGFLNVYVEGDASPLSPVGCDPSFNVSVEGGAALAETLYDLGSVVVVKAVRVDSLRSFIDLNISVVGDGVCLESLRLPVWVALDRRVVDVSVDEGGATLYTDLGRFRVDAYGVVEDVEAFHGNSSGGQVGVVFTFSGQSGRIDGGLRVEDPDAGARGGPVVYKSSEQLIEAYGVRYALTLWDEYSYNVNLEGSGVFRLVYRNDRVSIFEVEGLGFKG